ncbi:MAG: putrescine aminotransferase [Parasphingorhabdus sp.]|jgi:putrescine aminotransferase
MTELFNPLDTEHYRELDNRHFVHPWEDLGDIRKNSRTVVTSGEGIYLIDSDGKKLIDGPGGMWCCQIGYGRKEMADAIAEQVMRIPYFSPFNLTSDVASVLSGKISELAPGDLDHVFFTTGGSTAVDTAFRFVSFRNNVLGRPEKKIIISRHDAYHGSTYLAASASGKSRDKNFQDQATHLFAHLSSPKPLNRPPEQSIDDFRDACIKELEDKILELGADKVAAFIAEPVLASGGVVVPPEGYHRMCLEVCRKYDVVYISDEVVTGFGRMGHWFASEEVFDIEPDIITSAKGLTSGYLPLGACIVSDRLMRDLHRPDGSSATFSNGFTYSAHPVSCAAALKNIEIMEQENILQHVRDITPYFQERLQELTELEIVKEVRGVGLMACVECQLGQGGASLADDYQMGSRIDKHCQQLGLIVRPLVNMCVMSPALIITRQQIDEMVNLLREGIVRATQDLKDEGLLD